MQQIADGEEYQMPATIDDPAILDEMQEALRGAGYAAAALRPEPYFGTGRLVGGGRCL